MTASVGFLAAVLAFLAVLALALMLAAGRLSASWQGELADTATLQIFAPEAQIEEQARAALEVLRTTPGVRSVRMVDLAEQERLLEPWLGPDVPVESLPLPLMVEVDDRPGRARPRRRWSRGCRPRRPGRSTTTTPPGGEPLVATAERLRLFAAGCLGLVALALAAVVGPRGAGGGGGERRGDRDAAARRGARPASSAARSTRRLALGALAGALARHGGRAARWWRCCRAAASRGSFSSGSASPAGSWLLPLLVPPAAGARSPGARRGRAARRGLRRWS